MQHEQLTTDTHTTFHGDVRVTNYADGSVCLFLAPPTVKNLVDDLSCMTEMYADEERDNWWDADDIARSVAEDIHALLSD